MLTKNQFRKYYGGSKWSFVIFVVIYRLLNWQKLPSVRSSLKVRCNVIVLCLLISTLPAWEIFTINALKANRNNTLSSNTFEGISSSKRMHFCLAETIPKNKSKCSVSGNDCTAECSSMSLPSTWQVARIWLASVIKRHALFFLFYISLQWIVHIV